MRTTKNVARSGGLIGTAVAALVLTAPGANAAVPLTKIITDPFTNTTSQHRATVEPDTFA